MKQCPKCHGKGIAKSGRNCPGCNGTGKVSESRFKELKTILQQVYKTNNETKNTWSII